MVGPKLDVKATALANGYSEGQAETLAMWTEKEVIALVSDMIRVDGKKPVFVWVGGYCSK